MKLDPYLTPYTKANSKGIMAIHVRAKTIKLLEENIGVNLGLGNAFLDMTPKAKVTQEKLDNLGFIKVKNFYAADDTTKKMKMKRQPLEYEKIFADHISDKGIYIKDSYNSVIKRQLILKIDRVY